MLCYLGPIRTNVEIVGKSRSDTENTHKVFVSTENTLKGQSQSITEG
jgi:hypothetical protein